MKIFSIIGMDALEHEAVWQVMYRRSLDFARRGTFTAGLSAIDIALWDIKGKHFGLPIHSLLGGKKTDVIQPYATGLYFTGKTRHGLMEKLVKEAGKDWELRTLAEIEDQKEQWDDVKAMKKKYHAIK